jgi:hypothetical protein
MSEPSSASVSPEAEVAAKVSALDCYEDWWPDAKLDFLGLIAGKRWDELAWLCFKAGFAAITKAKEADTKRDEAVRDLVVLAKEMKLCGLQVNPDSIIHRFEKRGAPAATETLGEKEA